jgi:hypothetical protein
MTREDKVWLSELAWMVVNAVVYMLGDGDHIRYFRSSGNELKDEIMEHAEK